jgi:RNA polymerase sigma-70 factor (ECF subfamily)
VRSNADLVNSSLAGNADAFGELVRRYERAVWTTAWRMLRNYHAAEDVTQETFLAAHRRLEKLRNPDSVGVWLLRIAHRKALGVVQRQKPTSSLASGTDLASAVQSAHLSTDLLDVLRALGELPEHERIVMALRYLDGYPVATVAELTGRPVGTVTQQLSRAIRRMQKRLNSEELNYEPR